MRSVHKDSEHFKSTVFSLALELLGFVCFEVLTSTFYTLLPAILPVLEAFLECLFLNTAQLCQSSFFNLLIKLKSSSFCYGFQLGEEKEVRY
jgi:hypothetical protein